MNPVVRFESFLSQNAYIIVIMRDILAYQGIGCARITALWPASAADPTESPRSRALDLAALLDLAIAAGFADPAEIRALLRDLMPVATARPRPA